MKNPIKYINKKDGFVFIILIIIIMGLGTLGLALAASTVSNIRAHESIQRLEHNFYDTDGSMTHVQAVLERACSYGRYNAKMAVEEAFESGMENGTPLSNDELINIFNNTFEYYILHGSGKLYIDEQLGDMKDDPQYKVEEVPVWNDIEYSIDGISLKVNSKKLLTNEKLIATFLLPYDYVTDLQRDIEYIRHEPAPAGTMPIGFYNPLFRSPLTMNSGLKLNGSANLYVDATSQTSTTGIALQWTNSISSNLLNTDARVDIYGTTLPLLKRDDGTLAGNSTGIYVNGINVTQTQACTSSNVVSLTDYYDSSYMSQVINNKSDGMNSYFEAVDNDIILRIYTGDANILSSDAGGEWSSLSGKRGLIVVAGNLYTNGGFNIDSFSGGVVVLGNNGSRLDSPIKLIHDEDAILQALELYRSTTGDSTVELMFKLNTLLQNSYDPEAVTLTTITGGHLFDSPLTIGNSYMSGDGECIAENYPYFRIAANKVYLKDTAKGLQATDSLVNFIPDGNIGFYQNKDLIWDEKDEGLNPVNSNVGNINDLIDMELIKSWINSGTTSISREKEAQENYILRIYTGDVLIDNGGKVGDDIIHGRSGLLFINGRLTIESPFNFNGAIIATNGIEVKFGDVQINYDMEHAIDALNSSPLAIALFKPGATVQQQTISVYDNISPKVRILNDNLTLFTAGVTISNVKFEYPYTSASIYGSMSDITLSDSSLIIVPSSAGKGLQSTTRNIFVSMGRYTKNAISCDAINSTTSGTFNSLNTISSIAANVNLPELANWLLGTQGSITVTSGNLALGLFSDGQSFDLTPFNGKEGFLFYNGELIINSDFNFNGVIVATHGISVTRGEVNITFDQKAALDAVALNTTATKIFLNLPASIIRTGTVTGASTSGSVNMYKKGVTIESWHTVK